MLPAAEVATSEAPFSLFVETYWGHGPAVWIAAFAAVSALGALNGWTLIQAEQPARLAEQGLLPARFARQNRHGRPASALLLSSVIATACCSLNNNKSTREMFTFIAVPESSGTSCREGGV